MLATYFSGDAPPSRHILYIVDWKTGTNNVAALPDHGSMPLLRAVDVPGKSHFFTTLFRTSNKSVLAHYSLSVLSTSQQCVRTKASSQRTARNLAGIIVPTKDL